MRFALQAVNWPPVAPSRPQLDGQDKNGNSSGHLMVQTEDPKHHELRAAPL